MWRILAGLLLLLVPACGEGGPAPSPEPAEPRPARLVQVGASTKWRLYEVGERIVLRRTFENVGDEPLSMNANAWSHRRYREIVITSEAGSRLYEAACADCPEGEVGPAHQVEIDQEVEIAGAGTYTLEVPPEYRSIGGEGRVVRREITVVDGGDPRLVERKIERLGSRIAQEGGDDPRLWTEAQSDLQNMGAAAAPHLRRWVREAESAHLRGVAAKLLWYAGGREGIEDLVAGLQDEVATVRQACLDSLGSFREPQTLDAILTLLQDEEMWVRVEAIETVAAFDDDRVRPALRKMLSDDEPFARRWAAIHLAKKKDPAGIRVLIQALEDDPVWEAGLVVPALGTLTGEDFGEADHPGLYSGVTHMEEAVKRCRAVAGKWLAWWEEEGRARYAR